MKRRITKELIDDYLAGKRMPRKIKKLVKRNAVYSISQFLKSPDGKEFHSMLLKNVEQCMKQIFDT